MKNILVATLVILFCSISFGSSGSCGQWPQIAPLSGQVTFASPAEAVVEVKITSPAMNPLYLLSCQSGDRDDKDFNYSGLFHCRLISLYSKETVSSLLIEDLPQTADWEGRSRFLLNQVVGRCGQLVDWGAERTFRLRGMRIILATHDVELGGKMEHPMIGPFTFVYSVQHDDAALTPIASKSPVEKPKWFAHGNECVKEVLSRHCPRSEDKGNSRKPLGSSHPLSGNVSINTE
jgi:hypothetical protein